MNNLTCLLLELPKKTTNRLRELRKKIRLLLHDSHNCGCGGIKDTQQYQDFQKVKQEIDYIIAERNKNGDL